MLSPEQRASAFRERLAKRYQDLQRTKQYSAIQYKLAGSSDAAFNCEVEAEEYAIIAAALTNELALAEQVRVLKEALEERLAEIDEGAFYDPDTADWSCSECGEQAEKQDRIKHADNCNSGKIRAALALPLPQAARQAAENAEKAGQWEDLTMLVRRLTHRLSKHEPDSMMVQQSQIYLTKINGNGSLLRDVKEQEADRG